MSKNKHTPEPWAVKGTTIRTADGIGIDVIATMQVSNQPFWDDDARRIVACVNACAGISTERLESLKIPLMKHLFGCDEHAANLVKQRDELLAALERAYSHIVEITNYCGKYHGLTGEIVSDSYIEATAAREAIASVKVNHAS